MIDFLSPFSVGGNIILWIIGVCSLLSFTIFIERFFYLRRVEVDAGQLMVNLRKCIQEKDIDEAIHLCERTGGPITSILSSGLMKHQEKKKNIEQAMEIAGSVQIAQLEKNTKALSIIAHITPLIGLLGTVIGFIHTFSAMQKTGMVDISASAIGDAMQYALITTAAGLVVAIPSVVAYNYLLSRISYFVLQIRVTTSELVEILQ